MKFFDGKLIKSQLIYLKDGVRMLFKIKKVQAQVLRKDEILKPKYNAFMYRIV